MRVFYVAHLLEEPFATLINAIRLFCDPAARHLAHITVRGPYTRLLPDGQIAEINAAIAGSRVQVLGGSTFGTPAQNTVFLACSCPKLPMVWDKPAYQYQPHITLYDGQSPVVARRLRSALHDNPVEFSFVIDRLDPLVVTRGQHDLSIRSSIPQRFCDFFEGAFRVPIQQVLSLDESGRLDFAEQLVAALSMYVRSTKQVVAPKRDREDVPPFAPLLCWAHIPLASA